MNTTETLAATAAMKKLMEITGRPDPISTTMQYAQEDVDIGEPVFSVEELMVQRPPPIVPSAAQETPVVVETQDMLIDLEKRVDRVIKDRDPSFQEAIDTKRTDKGSQIGSWQIEREDATGTVLYSVVHADSGLRIAVDLSLYEAAYGLAKSLYAGHAVNSHQVMSLLRVEREYAGALQDAVVYRQRRDQAKGDLVRRSICEDRYETAKSRAIQARSQIESINRSIIKRSI